MSFTKHFFGEIQFYRLDTEPVDWSPLAAHFVVVVVMIDKKRSLTCGKPCILTAYLTFNVMSSIRQWIRNKACDKQTNY